MYKLVKASKKDIPRLIQYKKNIIYIQIIKTAGVMNPCFVSHM